MTIKPKNTGFFDEQYEQGQLHLCPPSLPTGGVAGKEKKGKCRICQFRNLNKWLIINLVIALI